MGKNSWKIKKKQQITYTEVDNDNFASLYDSILDVIGHANYIAIDTEFSGHSKDISKNMEDRYKDLSDIIRSHSLLSFGLTVITNTTNDQTDPTSSTLYHISNFEFLTLNQQSFKIDPTNIKFLVENGFDFGRIFQCGIPFTSGAIATKHSKNNDHSKKSNYNKHFDKKDDLLRQLWHSILRIIHEKNIPIIVHNGLLDIMYLYDSFISSLPSKLSTFVADLVEMFPSGIYDTKYISTAMVGESKSYLAYLYCKYSRFQEQQQQHSSSPSSSSWSIHMLPNLKPLSSATTVAASSAAIIIDNDDEDDIEVSPSKKRRLRMKKIKEEKKRASGICGQYSQHGWCVRGGECTLSHDLDAILDFDLGVKKNDNNNDDHEKEKQSLSPTITSSTLNDDQQTNDEAEDKMDIASPSTSAPRRDHASHFDAYMTAFIFCYYISTLSKETLSSSINKLNLMRLDIPLRIAESHYSKPSKEWTCIKSKIYVTTNTSDKLTSMS